MKKRKVNALLAIVLSLTMLVGVTGCGKEQQLEAEINPDTPATEVQFPFKENAEQLLNSVMQDEKDVQDKVKKQQVLQGGRLEKDW